MARLIKGMLSTFVEVIPFSESFFLKTDIPDVSLTKEMVLLNYGRLSPYRNNTDILFFKDKDNLYLWFTNRPTDSKRIKIPEGYLIFKRYRSEGDAIVIKETPSGVSIVVIRGGRLVAQLFRKINNDAYMEALKKEYSLKDARIIRIKGNESYKVGFDDLLAFLPSVSMDARTFLKKLYDDLKLPVIVLLLMVNLLGIASYEYVNNLVKQKQEELAALKQRNVKIKEAFSTLEQTSRFFVKFKKSELSYPNLYDVLSTITGVVKRRKGHMTMYRQSANLISLWVVSNATSNIVNDLVASGMFDNVQVLRISQWYKDKTKELGQIEMKLKAIGVHEQ